MRRFKSSSLSRNMAEVIKEAKANGVIIECRRSNGEVEEELVLTSSKQLVSIPTVDKDGNESSLVAVVVSKERWMNADEDTTILNTDTQLAGRIAKSLENKDTFTFGDIRKSMYGSVTGGDEDESK